MSKGFFQLISLTLFLVLVLVGVGSGVAKANPGWYNASWDYRKKITINSANVSADLTNFPVLISLASDSDLASDAQNDGDDILFTADDEVTKLSHEIETFNGTSGQLVAWVKIPSLSSLVDTEIYMYYGNSGASDQQDAASVWDSSYAMVQHLQEASGGANAIKDSTSNANHGTDNNSPTFGAAGQIDGAIDFDKPSSEYIQLPNSNTILDSDNFTVEAWIKTTTNHPAYGDGDMEGRIVNLQRDNVSVSTGMSLYAESDNIGLLYHTGSAHVWKRYAVNYWDGAGHHVAVTHSTSDNTWRLYFDGTQVLTQVDDFGDFGAHPTYVGAYDGASRYFDGIIDEVRISDDACTADWILTGYNNQSNPSDFITLGSEETGVVAPSVTTDSATLVEETTATLNGTLDDDGGENCQYSFEWGTATGVYSDNISWTGSISTGQSFSTAISSLNKGDVYYFRAKVKNSAGVTNGSEVTFLTKPDEPTSFSATAAGDDQVDLTWSKGEGANRTMVRRKLGSYPTGVTDGSEVYFDTGTNTSDTGLSSGTTYFYRAWSEVTGSQQWSDNHASDNATTTGSPPTAVGGIIFPVSKAQVFTPWLLLFMGLSGAVAWGVYRLRKRP